MSGEVTGTGVVSIPVEFYFDYSCPFCYVASVRLDRLIRRYPIVVQYRFIETHPDCPATGRTAPEAPGGAWADQPGRPEALRAMAAEHRIPLVERRVTTNSRRAILLGQTVLDQRPERFRALHADLFNSHFVLDHNIGDADVLTGLALHHGVDDLLPAAWGEQAPLARLLEHIEVAQRQGLSDVPTLVVGGRAFPGAVAVDTFEQALARDGLQPRED